jgi:hypothetical protein
MKLSFISQIVLSFYPWEPYAVAKLGNQSLYHCFFYLEYRSFPEKSTLFFYYD